MPRADFHAAPSLFQLFNSSLLPRCFQSFEEGDGISCAGSKWSPKWVFSVDIDKDMSRTPIPQIHGNSKAFCWPKGCWGTFDLYLKPVHADFQPLLLPPRWLWPKTVGLTVLRPTLVTPALNYAIYTDLPRLLLSLSHFLPHQAIAVSYSSNRIYHTVMEPPRW